MYFFESPTFEFKTDDGNVVWIMTSVFPEAANANLMIMTPFAMQVTTTQQQRIPEKKVFETVSGKFFCCDSIR